jgi:hypothetical protein
VAASSQQAGAKVEDSGAKSTADDGPLTDKSVGLTFASTTSGQCRHPDL